MNGKLFAFKLDARDFFLLLAFFFVFTDKGMMHFKFQ